MAQYSSPIGPIPLNLGGGNVLPAAPAPASSITPNLPIWTIPIFGSLILLWLGGTRYFTAVAVVLVGMIFYWLLNG
jgi:hypothetical protein